MADEQIVIGAETQHPLNGRLSTIEDAIVATNFLREDLSLIQTKYLL
ncbi:hypothetical protein ACQKKK_20345 [Peribacillus sp. NPDC006672]